jgi:penicillin-binding protein 1C
MRFPRLRKWLRRLLYLCLWLAAGWWGVPWLFPWPEGLNKAPQPAAEITDAAGAPLRRLMEKDGRHAGGGSVPQALVLATLAAEDHRFRSHGGVDFAASARAVRDAMKAGRSTSGASTITQQLVKLAEPRPRTVWTKVVEIFTARRVEMTWDKDTILTAYLDRLSYGSLARGGREAADAFFAKPLADCSLAECAFLAGLPQAPGRLNPWRNFDGAKKRQEWILARLRALEWITPEEQARALAEPLRLRKNASAFRAPHLVDMVLATLPEDLPPGSRIATTVDMEMQELCERVIRDRLSRLKEQNVKHAAAVVIENATGRVLALVGSPDYAGADGGQVNGATARRSPGSALKPFTYLLALQGGMSPGEVIPDLPVEFMTPTGIYRPENYNHRAAGPVSLRQALANSLNLSAVRLLQQHGGAAALVEALERAGIHTLTKPADDYGLGLTIGGGEVTLLELTSAYSTLARLGIHRPAVLRTDAPDAGGQRVFDPAACYLLADMLSDNDARVRSFGEDSALRLPFPVAVKTGTSTDYRDNWTVGYNPGYTVGVWAGNFDGTPMRGVSGVSGAAPMFRDIFTWLDTHRPARWYETPPEVVEVEVDPLTGAPVPQPLKGRRPSVVEKFLRELAPAKNADTAANYDAGGRVLLPADYATWLASPDNWLGNQAVASARAAASQAFRILSPLPGTSILLDPDLPDGGRRLPLRANSPNTEWTCPTLEITRTPRGSTALLTPGRHEFTARSPGGEEKRTWVTVKAL